ncbi:MAG TPA: flavin reductase family protein [Spirochaetota bacterium]|nr:flavin reductase family protein [Spirochaetota bacterium]
MKTFDELDPKALNESVFKLIGSDWMLITAGNMESYNTMTASWGGLGHLWNLDVCFCFVRPTRHTHGFMERSETFSISFFEEKYREALDYCGSHSGKDVDKAKETGLTPVSGDRGTVYFDEARIVLECEKIYYQDINPDHFLDSSIESHYPIKDYHRMYIGRVLKALKV